MRKMTRMRKMICELCGLDLYYGPLSMLSEKSNHRICLIRAQYSIVSATNKSAVQWKRGGENVSILFRLFHPYHKYKYHPKQTLTFFTPTSQHVIQFLFKQTANAPPPSPNSVFLFEGNQTHTHIYFSVLFWIRSHF